MNYSTLFTTVKGYLENDFPATAFTGSTGGSVSFTSVEQINTFITQAEKRIYNTVLFPALRSNVTGTTSTNNKYLNCPGDFLAVYSMAVVDGTGAYEFLLNKDVSFIRSAYPVPTDTGIPAHYALFGPVSTDETELTFILGPTPDAVYTVELHYYYYPESITIAASGFTWLSENFDPVLLYGSLVEAYTFMKGEADVIAFYEKKYQESMMMAKRLGDGMEKQDQYRSGTPRVPVS
jgi:hypothetical protein